MAYDRFNSTVSKNISTIDITPLMDLTFMLLIIFIITVPSLEFTTEVSPPEMNTPVTVEDIPNKVMVALSKDGMVTVNDQPIALAGLRQALASMMTANPEMAVLIVADGSRPYEDVIALHREAAEAGVRRIHLVTQPTSKP